MRLRSRLILVYLAATLLPVALTVWASWALLDHSLNSQPLAELDESSAMLERLGREYYQTAREQLSADAAAGRVEPRLYPAAGAPTFPPELVEFLESGEDRRFETSGADGRILQLLERTPSGIRVYSRDLGIGMNEVAGRFTTAREAVNQARASDLRSGLFWTLMLISSAVWLGGLGFLIYWATRLTRPVQRLARGLRAVAEGDLAHRLPVDRDDEIGAATAAFNSMADDLRESREKLIRVTRLESWQALARKTAHEVKNSLTPIRLTIEEIAARNGNQDEFLGQAAQIVVDEVISLEKRVRAFSELASEPPVTEIQLDINTVVEERVALLRAAHPEVLYDTRLAPERPVAVADVDLIRGVLTNLIENAADAARAGGIVRIKTASSDDRVAIEVHDSGPGLSALAQGSLFQPTISFKKNGMGLGLSIARKSALLCGGDVKLIDGELGGAAFRLELRGAAHAG